MSLLSFLQKNELARRVFGRRELKIIEKQLLGINLTQSERNRLSRDIRKKLEFIQAIARFEGEFALKKGAETKKKIEEVTEIILKDIHHSRIKAVILFGSFVENTFTFHSDLDFAVVFEGINLKEATLFRKRVLGKAPEKADIQVYNLLPDKIKKEIDQKGKILYERKN